jgi:hypothetical protein
MWIVAKTIKNHEYMYSKSYSILCESKKQAEKLAEHLIMNNEKSVGSWKLNENETWFVYEIDKYDSIPPYKLKSTKGKISVVENI